LAAGPLLPYLRDLSHVENTSRELFSLR
jgi:hypothetical protein